MENKKEEEEITFCEWTTHKGIRCCSRTKNNTNTKLCVKHLVLKNDYVVLKPETVKEKKLSCATKKEIKFVPRTREHIKNMMTKLVYEDTDTVEVIVLGDGGDTVDGDISNEFYIELNSDATKFYYKAIRGQHKIKELKIKLIDYCQHDPIILTNDDYYCKDCYISLAKKRGYPTLKTLSLNSIGTT